MVTPATVAEKYLALPSGKHSGRRGITQMLAVHSAECPMERGYARSLTEGFLNIMISAGGPEASINGFADPGVFVRAVHTDYAAWHASWANPVSVGYETAAYAAFDRAKWMSLEGRRMLERLAIEMAEDAKRYDIPLRWLTGRQVNAIRAGNRKIKGLSAHRQIDPAYRTDPGDGFPYGYLLKRIKAHTNGTAANGPGTKPAADTVQPIKEEEDDMLHPNYRGNTDRQELTPDEWQYLRVNTGTNHVSMANGREAGLVNGHVYLYATGIKPGYALKVEWMRIDVDKETKAEEGVGYGACEIPDTAGGCSNAIPVTCNMPPGANHRLRIRVLTYNEGVVVHNVDPRIHYQKQTR